MAFSAWCATAAFGAYFCMYGFRKPFTSAAYDGLSAWGLGYKSVLVQSQVLGYMVSKFIGVRVVSAIRPEWRAAGILGLIGFAELALFLFAIIPPPYHLVCFFLNGLPLGMVFGLVLGFLEGRRMTEALAAGLVASFILADGVTKSVGAQLLRLGVSELWMPCVAGLVYLPFLVFFVWMLSRIPPPSAVDVEHRGERIPMTRSDRSAFSARYAFGLICIVAVYTLTNILRGIRADFAPEIWKGLGWIASPEDYSRSELPVMLGVVAACGLTVLIRDNRRAFHASMGVAMAGLVLVVLAALGWQTGRIGAFPFMVTVGLGIYLPYAAVHTTIFERLIAMTRDRGNICYLMALADAFGYLGYVVVLQFAGGDKLRFFLVSLWASMAVAGLLLILGWVWFGRISSSSLASKHEGCPS
ncbi:MAG: hypothetical protein ABS79_02250 [Planctomycetes bacterium SCN 63-9]|nr:MAG: hypothetical protein ABS79_02250 [Planctomycetes bacterium SCN 63-9]